MPTIPKQSPAVQSVRQEQKEQETRTPTNELDAALEDTFPASDPVSATHRVTSVGRFDTESAESSNGPSDFDAAAEEDLPEHEVVAGYDPDRNEMDSAWREAPRTTEPAMQSDPSPAASIGGGVHGVAHTVAERIRRQPLTAVAIAAALAFVIGATRS